MLTIQLEKKIPFTNLAELIEQINPPDEYHLTYMYSHGRPFCTQTDCEALEARLMEYPIYVPNVHPALMDEAVVYDVLNNKGCITISFQMNNNGYNL
jgi:hypothetical protein